MVNTGLNRSLLVVDWSIEVADQFIEILYFFTYKMEFYSFQNNHKNLDPSYKTDLDFWDCSEKLNSYYSKSA